MILYQTENSCSCCYAITELREPRQLTRHSERPGFYPRQVQEIFALLHGVQTGSGAHTASYPMSTQRSFPGVKRQGREADN
jgi:hypothetical protein